MFFSEIVLDIEIQGLRVHTFSVLALYSEAPIDKGYITKTTILYFLFFTTWLTKTNEVIVSRKNIK